MCCSRNKVYNSHLHHHAVEFPQNQLTCGLKFFFSGKLTTLRVKQSSGSYCSFLLTFKNDDHNSQGGMELFKSVKVVSIHPLSKNKFLVLDSSGLLHVFSLSNEKMGSGASSKQYSENIHTYRLDYPMKVQLTAVFPSSSTSKFLFWISCFSFMVWFTSLINLSRVFVQRHSFFGFQMVGTLYMLCQLLMLNPLTATMEMVSEKGS